MACCIRLSDALELFLAANPDRTADAPLIGARLMCLVVVVSAVVVNAWEWFSPEINEKLFGKG